LQYKSYPETLIEYDLRTFKIVDINFNRSIRGSRVGCNSFIAFCATGDKVVYDRKMRTTIQSSSRSVGKSIIFGAIGGFVGGLVMIPFMMLTAMMAGMPANTIVVAMGLAFGANQNDAMTSGLGMHILTSALIGVIFGAVTALVGKLRITGFRKGIVEGLITGMIAFAVLFIPITMAVMPPVLINMMIQMNPSITQQQAMGMLQQGMPMMMGIGVLEHLVYGAVLGAITSALVLKLGARKEGRESSTRIADSSENQ
jgi:hypothetical protein